MPEDQSKAVRNDKTPNLQPAAEEPGGESSAANSTDAGSSSRNQSSGKTAPERAQQELERQLDSGEENPT